MDVVILEKVFKALQPHVLAKTHYGVIMGEDRGSCQECGSYSLEINKHAISASGEKKIKYRCTNCGKYVTKADK